MEVRVFSTAPSPVGRFERCERPRAAGLRPVLCAAIVAACLFGLTTAAAAQSVGGRYRVQGTNPNGSHYGGTAMITPSSNTTCRVTWHTGSTSVGICMLAGKVLAASYALNGRVGLVVYRLEPDGSLKGVWTVADQPGSGTETLTPASAK